MLTVPLVSLLLGHSPGHATSPPEASVPTAPLPAFRRGVPRPSQRTHRRPVRAGEATTPLTGRLLYEDHRVLGRHAARHDLALRPGTSRNRHVDASADYLGALWMTVDVYELDRRGVLGQGCHREEWVGSAVVQADGTFTVDVPAHDRCTPEADGTPHYVVRAATRYCHDDLCFQLGPRSHSTYALWYGRDHALRLGPDASTDNLLLFSPVGERDPSVHARAAGHYASLVDAVQALHVEGGVPFLLEPYGPLQVRFPSQWSRGRATRDDLVDIRNTGWPKGSLLIHEYAHIVHRRAWGGDYAGFPDPVQSWSGSRHSQEVPFIALKEGWANFVTSYVIGRCFRPAFDTRDDLFSLEHPAAGIHFPQNHQRAFCDWVDARPDRRDGTVVGDTAQVSIVELWALLAQTDDRLDDYTHHHPVREGLDLCDLVGAHLVGLDDLSPTERRARVVETYGVLENNDLACPASTAAWRALGSPQTASLPTAPSAAPAPLGGPATAAGP